MTLTNGPNAVTVTMDHLYELDASGSIIGNTGPNSEKHSRNTFASVDFTINDTPVRTGEYGVPADSIDFSSTLVGSSTLLVKTLVFLHHGLIRPTANESWTVAGGTIKFSVQVSTWPFCAGESGNPCKGSTGAFLEFGMEIKGATEASLPDGEKRYTLSTDPATGNNVTLDLSDEVLLDGQWVQMPTGYPRVVMQGGKQLFQFRLPRFTTSAMYDPIVSGLGTPYTPSPSPSQPTEPGLAYTTSTMITASGSISDYPATIQQAIIDVVAVAAGVPSSALAITITAASVIITVRITTSSSAEMTAVATTLEAALSDTASATTLLRQAVSDISVLSVPIVTVSVSSGGPATTPTSSTPMLVIIFCGVGVVILAVAVAVGMKKSKHGLVKRPQSPHMIPVLPGNEEEINGAPAGPRPSWQSAQV